MTFRFRPLVGFTVFSVVMFACLMGLGVWQLERLQWKRGLIADINRNMHAAPVSIDAVISGGLSAAQYRRVALSGQFLNADEVYVFTTGFRGEPVYHVLTPLVLYDGRVFMIDRGLVPPMLRDPGLRRRGEMPGELRVVGIVRTPDRPGPFTPDPDRAHRIWFARDLNGMASVEHLKLALPVIIEADATPNPGGWPLGGQTVVNIPNNHLQYAITWFLLAGALLVIYFAYHQSRGRLSFGAG
jgi:surfeit locus 1 family protein